MKKDVIEVLTKKAIDIISMNADVRDAEQVREFGKFLKSERNFLDEAVNVQKTFCNYYSPGELYNDVSNSIDTAVKLVLQWSLVD